MNSPDSEIVMRALRRVPSRRHVLRGLAGLGLTLGGSWLPKGADAKQKKKNKTKKATLCLDGQTVQASGKKKKKLLKGGAIPGACAAPPPPPPPPPPPGVPNQYGCFSVDVPCTSADECCTGVCEGGLCRAHDTGICDQAADGKCLAANPYLTVCNSLATCACLETTGGSKFCGAFEVWECTDCRKDADCLALGYPAGSACAPFAEGICAGACASGMVCMAPCGTKPVEM